MLLPKGFIRPHAPHDWEVPPCNFFPPLDRSVPWPWFFPPPPGWVNYTFLCLILSDPSDEDVDVIEGDDDNEFMDLS